jgi:hypothetical protein
VRGAEEKDWEMVEDVQRAEEVWVEEARSGL